MRSSLLCAAGALFGIPPAVGAPLQVTTTADAGPGSLRQALQDANANGEADTIRFAPSLAGQTLEPATPLPPLTEAGTRIIGDIDPDGVPDVSISGANLTGRWCAGLHVRSDGNTLSRLHIEGFTVAQILLEGGSGNVIRGCRVSTDITGTEARIGGDGIWIVGGANNTIGAPNGGRNLILGASRAVGLWGTDGNRVVGNFIGTDVTGSIPLQDTAAGVVIVAEPLPCSHNLIGGPAPRDRNVISGPGTAVIIEGLGAHHNRVVGNYLQLAADGRDPIANIVRGCVTLAGGASRNTIGGPRGAGGNAMHGNVTITDAGTDDNRIIGNYIGLNGQGKGSFRRPQGVRVVDEAGRQYIGDEDPALGNYLCGGVDATCLRFDEAGYGSIVRNNVFGLDATGSPAGFADTGLSVYYSRVLIDRNLFSGIHGRAVYVHHGRPTLTRNTFEANGTAVVIGEEGNPVLGDLGNAAALDDGGNVFEASNTWSIFCYQPQNIKAEGNQWGTALASEINARIWDGRDDPGVGIVDFRPYRRPVASTAVALAVTALTAVPSPEGVEIGVTLSASADVACIVRNLAGRPVRTLRSDKTRSAGPYALVWDRRCDNGVAAPSGRYVVEVTARGSDGQQASAVAPLTINR